MLLFENVEGVRPPAPDIPVLSNDKYIFLNFITVRTFRTYAGSQQSTPRQNSPESFPLKEVRRKL